MSERVVLLGIVLWLILAFTSFVEKSCGQDVKPCEVIRDYMSRVDQICVFSFGKERDAKLMEAQKALSEHLDKLGYSPSSKLTELRLKYVNLSSFGHDRMRKGDARLLVQAKDVARLIKELCPW